MAWLHHGGTDTRLLRAQYRFVRRQAFYLYGICFLCGWFLALLHWDVAPLWATVTYPALVSLLTAVRVFKLWTTRDYQPSDAELLEWRRTAKVIAVLAPSLYSAWALFLFPYGGLDLQVLVAFTIAVVNLICLFSLIHMRPVAVFNAFCTNTLFFLFLAYVGGGIFVAFAFLGILATVSGFLILDNHYRGFVRLIGVQSELEQHSHDLEKKQEETQKLSDLNYYIANHDSMTGLPNRRCFFQTLDTLFEETRSGANRYGLCVFDLGGLKAINDVYSVKTGDELIRQVVTRLKKNLPIGGMAGRLAGDEFAVIGPMDTFDFASAKRFLDTVLEAPCTLPEGSMHLNHFMGYAELDASAASSTVTLERALFAAQQARRTRNNPAVMFDEALKAVMDRRILLSNALRTADLDRELYVVFQPIVNIKTNSVIGAECLARWDSAQVGFVPPSDFIPVAESSWQINRMTLILLRKAMTAATAWPENLRLSFNLSATNLSSGGFVEEFLGILNEFGFDPRRMNCEVTETSIMWDIQEANRAIGILKSAGIGLSLDDFGTGYSSLSHVHSLPLDCIKIDRSFVSGINPDTTGYGIVKSLLALSREMEIGCVVEGVETEEELDVLRQIGASCVQGYLFSKPVPADELTRLLEERSGAVEPVPVSLTRAS